MAVRREEVRIHVTSNLGPVAARDAAGVRLLADNLDGLSRNAVQSDRASQQMARSTRATTTANNQAAVSARQVALAAQRVAAAEQAVSKANDAAADATGRVRVAQTRLNELRERAKAKASQLQAAEEALAKAQRAQAQASAKQQAATLALTEARAKAAREAADARRQAAAAEQETERSTRRSGDSINQLTGRIRVLADAFAILGPALAPIGALAVPAVTGLANQLGFAAAAAGTAVLAFQGVGDAVTAMNDYALEPTAANAEKVQEALAKLSPAAAQFAREISGMRDQFAATRDAAAEGLFGGLTPALDDLDGLLGRVQPVLREIGSATGDMLADGLESLNSDRWQPFFDFLQAEARPVLMELGGAVGDFGHGLAELWMAFQPLNRDFSGWIRDVASSFDGWAAGLAETEGFNDFIAYIRESGPQVASALGALGGALVDIVTAASPLGGPVLAGIEAFSKAVSAIADSPIGPVLLSAAAAMALFNRAMAVGTRVAAGNFFATTAANVGTLTTGMQRAQTQAMSLRSSLAAISAGRGASAAAAALPAGSQAANQAAVLATNADRARASLAGMAGQAGRVAGPMAGMALAMSGAGDKIMGANTASMALIGSMGGPWGAAIGGAIGLIQELAGANDELVAATEEAAAAMDSGSVQQMTREYRELRDTMQDTEDVGGFWEATFGGGIVEKAMSGLTGATAESQDRLAALGGALTEAGGQTTRYATETQRAAGAAAAAAANVARLSQQMRAQAAAASEAFDAQTAWGQAVSDARQQAATGARGIDAMTEAGRANRGALASLRDAWNNMSPAVKNNMDRYQAARRTFLDVADGMDIGRDKARRLADTMLDVPKRVLTRVDADIRRANKDLNLTEGQINKLSRRVAKPRVVPDISRAQRNLGNMRGRLDEIGSQRVSPTIDANSRPGMSKLRALEAANRRFGGSRWTGLLDANNAPAVGKIGRTGSLLGNIQKQVTRPNIDANPSPFMGKAQGVRNAAMQLGGMRPTPTVGLNDAASGPIGGIRAGLAAIQSKTVTVTVVTRNVKANAAGGYYGSTAGDVRNGHMPQMASGGVTRMWAEPETGGESYIPHANDWRRPRARSIAEQTVGILGGQVQWYAQGGVRAAERAGVEAAMRSGGGNQRVSFGNATATVRVQMPNGQTYPADLIWNTATEAAQAVMADRDEQAFVDSTRYVG